MDHEKVLALFDRQMRLGAQPDEPGARIERVGGVVRHIGPPGSWHGVLWSDLDEDTVDAAIAEQVRLFTELGGEAEWKTYSHDRPADLPERLAAAGFVAEERETLLVAETAVLPLDTAPPEGVRLLPVTDEEHIALVEAVHAQAFESERSVIGHQIRQQLANDPGTVPAVLAMAGDEPVSAARLELHPGTDFASLWGGGTVPAWRGRGIYRALVAYRVRIAAERGFSYVQVDASEYSRPILERLGFEALGTTTPYVWEASGTDAH
ncbi:GNAT family N-acetyltransferase [Streptomyces sp. VRA16 Mangrove soil]|uniref:GNAT family N-acetyltransferase n=1 Tax=Streptomyces sp. VRA16 Mangrove soil TaxID=2817434 RepID=UPI001A9DB6E5|nr:GNAT family N-acetyltransferase [Streptomyces sp. VRA16 Mangrove soil]MBO1332954.1 GNAT family N-acetyltransferase [Streptomyces sp. VRA16 Mangrove soil]